VHAAYDHYRLPHGICVHAEARGTCPWDRPATTAVLEEVAQERRSQDAKWGEQNHADGTGSLMEKQISNTARQMTDLHARTGQLTWKDILNEEFYEAMAEDDPTKLRVELIQVAAVASAWAEAIGRRLAVQA
jgi:hypothetical protein